MRGKAGWPLCGLPCIGITPAYAGKSQPWRSYSQRRWDHPRVCGEKRPAVDGKRPLRGSPPHVRGKGFSGFFCAVFVGITPACAGKSVSRGHAPPAGRDHPRVCGEKYHASPIPGFRLRITPACAGKSCAGCVAAVTVKDHPRVCGEKSHCVRSLYVVLGSPPRVRGKGSILAGRVGAKGITPACAGKRVNVILEFAQP